MGHLTGDHVDLVRMGGRDHHVGVPGPGPVQHIGIGRESGDPLDVQRVRRAVHEVRVVVDNRDVIALAREVARDLPADLPRATDDDLHAPPSPWTRSSGLSDAGEAVNHASSSLLTWATRAPARFDVTTFSDFSLRCKAERSMPTNVGGAADIAAKAIDLRQEVFPLEDLARLAQRQGREAARENDPLVAAFRADIRRGDFRGRDLLRGPIRGSGPVRSHCGAAARSPARPSSAAS